MPEHTADSRSIPARLKELREAAQLSQGAVAEALGISQSRYSKLENGDAPARLVHLLRAARLYRGDVVALFPMYQPSPEERELLAHASDAAPLAA